MIKKIEIAFNYILEMPLKFVDDFIILGEPRRSINTKLSDGRMVRWVTFFEHIPA